MDQQIIKEKIETVFKNVIDAINSTNGDQLNTTPFEESWTIGQVADHIILCSRGVLDNQYKDSDRPYDEKVAMLDQIFLDMNQKSKSSPAVTPKAPPHNKEVLISELENNKNNLLSIINERDLSQLSLDMEFPYLGYLTRHEWLSFIAVHTQRHLNQINNIKEHFSKKESIKYL